MAGLIIAAKIFSDQYGTGRERVPPAMRRLIEPCFLPVAAPTRTIAAARGCVYNPRVLIPIFPRKGVAR
jgi:hypothetical protein